MRVLADAAAKRVCLVTRNGKDKSEQFPELVLGLRELARRAGRTVLLDGEVVARAKRRRGASAGEMSAFQQLQSRMHLRKADEIVRLAIEAPTSFAAFDLLRDGRVPLLSLPWSERRARLATLFETAHDPDDSSVLLSDSSTRGATMLGRARRAGWEGIIAKRTDAPYRSGTRSDDWLKLKLLFRSEFVVGGFTEPRKTRPYFGALLLGAYDKEGSLVYVGHTGGGFTHEALADMHGRLTKIERRTAPFLKRPHTNERAHWVTPKLVVEVKFAEWTAGHLLRQPIFLGVRDDKSPRDVTIEGVSLQRWGTGEVKHDAA
jgi:bifunctional non-homologous end joining protein LigD